MKMFNKIVFSLLAVILSIATFDSCAPHHRRGKVKKAKVHVYNILNTSTVATDDFLYYYVIYTNNGGYSYTSSPTPLSSFDNVSWNSQPNVSESVFANAQEFQTTEVNISELPDSFGDQISANEISEIEVDITGESAEYGETESSTDSGGDGGDGGDGGGD